MLKFLGSNLAKKVYFGKENASSQKIHDIRHHQLLFLKMGCFQLIFQANPVREDGIF